MPLDERRERHAALLHGIIENGRLSTVNPKKPYARRSAA